MGCLGLLDTIQNERACSKCKLKLPRMMISSCNMSSLVRLCMSKIAGDPLVVS